MGLHEEYLNVVRIYGAKDLTDRRIADYIWELDNTGLTISRISSKRYGKERVVRLGVPINTGNSIRKGRAVIILYYNNNYANKIDLTPILLDFFFLTYNSLFCIVDPS